MSRCLVSVAIAVSFYLLVCLIIRTGFMKPAMGFGGKGSVVYLNDVSKHIGSTPVIWFLYPFAQLDYHMTGTDYIFEYNY